MKIFFPSRIIKFLPTLSSLIFGKKIVKEYSHHLKRSQERHNESINNAKNPILLKHLIIGIIDIQNMSILSDKIDMFKKRENPLNAGVFSWSNDYHILDTDKNLFFSSRGISSNIPNFCEHIHVESLRVCGGAPFILLTFKIKDSFAANCMVNALKPHKHGLSRELSSIWPFRLFYRNKKTSGISYVGTGFDVSNMANIICDDIRNEAIQFSRKHLGYGKDSAVNIMECYECNRTTDRERFREHSFYHLAKGNSDCFSNNHQDISLPSDPSSQPYRVFTQFGKNSLDEYQMFGLSLTLFLSAYPNYLYRILTKCYFRHKIPLVSYGISQFEYAKIEKDHNIYKIICDDNILIHRLQGLDLTNYKYGRKDAYCLDAILKNKRDVASKILSDELDIRLKHTRNSASLLSIAVTLVLQIITVAISLIAIYIALSNS